jgi:TolA-binding protein
MEVIYNTSRADYVRGEYALAYNGFKQIFEALKTGELAENSLYWMAQCMLDAKQPANAKILFESLLSSFPQGAKVCVTLFKLSGMAAESADTTLQKQRLQTLLQTPSCANTSEFTRAAEQLEVLQ